MIKKLHSIYIEHYYKYSESKVISAISHLVRNSTCIIAIYTYLLYPIH